MISERILIYGSGRIAGLLSDVLVRQQHRVIIAGRNQTQVESLAKQHDIPGIVATVMDPRLNDALQDCTYLINTAGPIIETAPALIEAAVDTHTHYIDVSNDYGVLRSALQFDHQARSLGVTIVPGVGFGVAAIECVTQLALESEPGSEYFELFVSTPSTGNSTLGVARTVKRALEIGPHVIKNGEITEYVLSQTNTEAEKSWSQPLLTGALEVTCHRKACQNVAIRYSTDPKRTQMPYIEIQVGKIENGQQRLIVGTNPVPTIMKRLIISIIEAISDGGISGLQTPGSALEPQTLEEIITRHINRSAE